MRALPILPLFALTGFAWSDSATLKIGQAPPPLSVGGWANGTPVKYLSPKKTYVVEFWATWCQPCQQSIPHLTELAKAEKGKVDFIGVSVWEQGEGIPAQVRRFVKQQGAAMQYSIAYDTARGKVAHTWMQAAGKNSIPTAFIVSRGKIAWIGNPLEGLPEALHGVLSGHLDAGAVKASSKKHSEEAGARVTKLFADVDALMKAQLYKQALDMIDLFYTAHPSDAATPGLSGFKFEALYMIDRNQALAYADALLPTDQMLYIIVLNVLLGGDLSQAPDLKTALIYAKRMDQSFEGEFWSAKFDLAICYSGLGDRESAIRCAKQALALGELPAAVADQLKQLIAKENQAQPQQKN